ncbi:MAG TPA: hypothetical protein VNU97_12550 [Rhizomicrobium sp.]|jgi:hypothetical protein|nr:hypothetical protein [Rhizomicrobium sp.]
MAWHIFRKDLRLLWPYVAGIAVLRFIRAGVTIRLGIFAEPHALAMLPTYLGLACMLASALLIVLAVHQDKVVGTQQDWLARPIKRRDLLLGKLLFVALAIEGPVFVASLCIALNHDLPLVAALGAALVGAFWGLVFSLPILAVAALTGTLLEAIVGLFALALCSYLPQLLMSLSENWVFNSLTTLWVTSGLKNLVLLGGSAVILPLQYFSRRTARLRAAALATSVLYVAVAQLPWATAFALAARALPDPAYADRVTIAFDPSLGQFRSPGDKPGRAEPYFFLPLRIAGLPRDAMLDTVRSRLTLLDADGRQVYQGPPKYDFFQETNRDGGFGLRLRPAAADGGTARLHQVFDMPPTLYARLRLQQLRVRIDYAFTLLRPDRTTVIAATGAARIVDGVGPCASRRSPLYNNEIEVWCFGNAPAPNCFVTFVRDRRSGRRDPDADQCFPGFEPRFLQQPDLDSPGRQLVVYGYHEYDDTGAHPLRIEDAADHDLVLTAYVPQAYFTRRVTTPPIRLADWEVVVTPRLPRKTVE